MCNEKLKNNEKANVVLLYHKASILCWDHIPKLNRIAESPNHPIRPNSGQYRGAKAIEHEPAGRDAEEVKAGDEPVEQIVDGVPPPKGEEEAKHGKKEAQSTRGTTPLPDTDQSQQQAKQPDIADKFRIAHAKDLA